MSSAWGCIVSSAPTTAEVFARTFDSTRVLAICIYLACTAICCPYFRELHWGWVVGSGSKVSAAPAVTTANACQSVSISLDVFSSLSPHTIHVLYRLYIPRAHLKSPALSSFSRVPQISGETCRLANPPARTVSCMGEEREFVNKCFSLNSCF